MDNSSRLEKCLKYGFAVRSEDMQPYCVVCKKAFSTGSLVPSKMKLHLQRRHPALAESPMTYFRLRYDQDCSDSPPPNYQRAENVPQQLVGIMTSHLQYLADEFYDR